MLVAFGLYLLISRIKQIRNGVMVEATVIDTRFVKAINNEDPDQLFVTFKFHTLNNEEITFTWDLGSRCKWQIGDKTTIVYQKYNPRKIVSFDYSSFWDATLIFSVALILITIAAGYYWAEHYFETLVVVK